MRKVLVVEDDREMADQMATCLAEGGYTVDLALDGNEAIERGRSGDYAVMTVDRMLPGLDGLEVVQKLRTTGVATPALIISALGEVDDRVRGLRAGGDDYLVKPFALAEMLARVDVRNDGRVVSRAMLLANVWDVHFDPMTNIVDVYVGRLRRKVDAGEAPPLIHTVRGVGFCLRAPQ